MPLNGTACATGWLGRPAENLKLRNNGQRYTRNMRPSEALKINRSRIREIALSHRVSDVRVFGSVLRGEDDANSDLDLLVEPTAQTTLMDIGAIRFELKKLLGFEVDVLTPNGLPISFREQVLREAVPV